MQGDTETAPHPPRLQVRSFVHQRNRFTEGQAHAWERLWPAYGLDVADVVSGAVSYDPQAWFGRSAPLVLEIGSGTGESTAAQAAAAPDTDHLAVEVFEPGLAQLLMRIEDAALTNLRLLRGDAVDLLRERVPPDSLAAVRIFFPDPWPKRRHHKRRLVRPVSSRSSLPAGSGRGPAPRHGLGPLRIPDAGGVCGRATPGEHLARTAGRCAPPSAPRQVRAPRPAGRP